MSPPLRPEGRRLLLLAMRDGHLHALRELAQEVGRSLTTVAQHIRRLEAEGLVEHRGPRASGWRITPLVCYTSGRRAGWIGGGESGRDALPAGGDGAKQASPSLLPIRPAPCWWVEATEVNEHLDPVSFA